MIMPYLTYDEYKDLGFNEIDNKEFNKLVKKAGDAVDSITRYFYQFNDLEDDIEFRRNQFKKAVAAQIEYFNDLGATSTHEMKEYGSVTIGRTTVSKGSRNSSASNESDNSLVSDDAIMYLKETGLLYKGLGVRS